MTDIEGSTRLWEHDQAAMSTALVRHDSLIRGAVENGNGYVFKAVGDAFYCAFGRPLDALRAAVDIQHLLAEEDWPAATTIAVRIGLHTGVCEERGGDYFGQPVNRAVRLQSLGHGGQIVVSEATAELVRDALPGGMSLFDLGEHRLKDLGRPEWVYQLQAEGLRSSFPPLRSLTTLRLRHNLPLQLTTFVGREIQLAEVNQLLTEARLVTLVGSGGAGKSRLALQLAAEQLDDAGDGAWLVELAPVADPQLVAREVGGILGVSEQPDHAMVDTLAERLHDRRLLIVLDNCEHVVDACAKLADALLRSCRRMTILATSREPLKITGEVVYRVPPLDVPPEEVEDPAGISRYEAVRLLTDRAIANRHDFALDDGNARSVASICRRLDGIPLALELAAVRLRSLSPEEVDSRLDHRFGLLKGGRWPGRAGLERQQTLRATIDWSYELLHHTEQLVLARLSVFAGGWTLDAAEVVCAGSDVETWEVLDLLSGLVDKSLVQADHPGGITRYELLETIRHYAAERLAEHGDTEVEAARRAHLAFYLAMAESARTGLRAAEQRVWLERLDLELGNLRSAIAFCRADPALALTGLQIARDLRMYWRSRQLYREGAEEIATLLELSGRTSPPDVRSRALTAEAELHSFMASYGPARARLEEAVALGRDLGQPALVADALQALAWIEYRQGRVGLGLALAEESAELALAGDDPLLTGDCLNCRACLRVEMGLSDDGDYEESLELFRRAGDRRSVSRGLNNLSLREMAGGDLDAAQAHLEEAIAVCSDLRDSDLLVLNSENLGVVHLLRGQHALALPLFHSSLEEARRAGGRRTVAYALLGMAIIASHQDRPEVAARLHGAADAILDQLEVILEALEAGIRDEDHERLRRALGDDGFQTAYQGGRALSEDQAVNVALEVTGGRDADREAGGAAGP
jgi:predicted ATPase/class 3 adenylate cyclase